MTQRDAARLLHDELTVALAARDDVEVVLEVPNDWTAADDSSRVLVADDGGGALLHGYFAEPSLRVCAIGTGRTGTRDLAAFCADHVRGGVPGIAKIRNVTTLREGRDRSTGNILVFFTMSATVRPAV